MIKWKFWDSIFAHPINDEIRSLKREVANLKEIISKYEEIVDDKLKLERKD